MRRRRRKCGSETSMSNSSIPVVALIFPVSTRVFVGDLDRFQVLGALEAELGGDAKPHRSAPLGGQWFLLEVKRQDGLRLKRARHVDAGRVSVETFEIDVAGGQVGADAAQKHAQWHAAPLTDLTPAFDTNVSRDLTLQRQ